MIEMKYLFWNTHNNKEINPILCDLIIENDISVVILAEYSANIKTLCTLLKTCGVHMQEGTTIGCERINILVNCRVNIEPELQTDRASFQIINKSTILCGLHLNSQIYSDNEERRNIYIGQIVSNILAVEKKIGTNNSIVVGDFNINPYDKSCISATKFHGIPIYEEARKKSRKVAGQEFYMFYNPMWNFFGDFSEPYGTYYHSSADTINPMSIQGTDHNYIVTCNNREEVETLIVKILKSRKVLNVMQELIRINQVKKTEETVEDKVVSANVE